MGRIFLSSESVTEGHPDKVADQIADAVVDTVLQQDPYGRVACEVLLTGHTAIVAGEVSTSAEFSVEDVVRKTLRRIGYTAETGYDAETVTVTNLLQQQSPDIARGVDVGGAGDQGIMFGYACDETPEAMPAPIQWAHTLAKKLAAERHKGTMPFLYPDGKTQVTVEYDEVGKPKRIDTIIISSHHQTGVPYDLMQDLIWSYVVEPTLGEWVDERTRFYFNPTGAFTVGGPVADTGLTGRKLMVDTYGGLALHGGGNANGKDCTKVDRSAAYLLRYLAKNIVAAGWCSRAQLQIAYAIGRVEPVSWYVDTFGTETIPAKEIEQRIAALRLFAPQAIIEHLDLRTPIFEQVAAYGHFGRTELFVPWERIDLFR